MISLLVAYLALFNRWLDDGGTVANFYDKPGLTYTLQGNVEFMRQFGRGGGGKKNNLFRGVSTLLRRTYVRFDKESHGSSIHPDLNMSEFSKLAIGKSFLGKVVRFFYSFTLRRMGRPAPFYEGYLFCFLGVGRDLQKTITKFTPLSELPGICGEDVCLFVESESFDTGGPNTCPTAIEHFLKKGENTFQPSAFCHFLTL